MSDRSIPPALPAEVVKSIWAEVLPKDMDPPVVAAIHQSLVMPSEELIEDFVQGAMEYPHFASSSDISRALKLDSTRVNWMIRRVRFKARENRK